MDQKPAWATRSPRTPVRNVVVFVVIIWADDDDDDDSPWLWLGPSHISPWAPGKAAKAWVCWYDEAPLEDKSYDIEFDLVKNIRKVEV